jgi:hypothetical protein
MAAALSPRAPVVSRFLLPSSGYYGCPNTGITAAVSWPRAFRGNSSVLIPRLPIHDPANLATVRRSSTTPGRDPASVTPLADWNLAEDNEKD